MRSESLRVVTKMPERRKQLLYVALSCLGRCFRGSIAQDVAHARRMAECNLEMKP